MNAPIVLGVVTIAAVSVLPGRALAVPPDPVARSATQVSEAQPPVPPLPLPPSPAPPPAAVAPPPIAAPPPPVVAPPEAVALVLLSPPEPSVKRGTVALVAAGVAVAAAGAGTVFGVLALQNRNDYARIPTYSNTDQGNNDAAYADGCIALAVAASVTSLVLSLTRDTHHSAGPTASGPEKRSADFSVSPLLAPPTAHGAGAGVLLRF